MPTNLELALILSEAHAAAAAAVNAAPFDEMRGDCGFAWVVIDGNSPLARYCRAKLKAMDPYATGNAARRPYGHKHWQRGWEFWGPGDYAGQRIDVKERAAAAFRDKLAEYGIRADVGSRLD